MIGHIVGDKAASRISLQAPSFEENRLAVFQAVLTGDEQKTRFLINTHPELIHAKTKTGNKSLLHIASANGHVSICDFLLDKGHVTNPVSDSGKTPYQFAKSDEIRKLLVEFHKNALCEKFYTASQTFNFVKVLNCEDFQRYVHILSTEINVNKQIVFAGTHMNLSPTNECLKEIPIIKTVFRGDILMTPYYGELLVIHENEQVKHLLNIAIFFIEQKTPYLERMETMKPQRDFCGTSAYLMFVSQGIERFPFLRNFPEENDRADIAEAKKMFFVFGINPLFGYFHSCSVSQKHLLVTQLPHCLPTMEFIENTLPKNSEDSKAVIWDAIYKEMYPKYSASDMM